MFSDRYNAVEADREDEEAGGFDWARQRYQRMFWETVPEGKVCRFSLSTFQRTNGVICPTGSNHARHFRRCHKIGHCYF
jgi:hypothetical protein